jgi:hypothetical protein
MRELRVLICGTGSGAHVLGAVISAKRGVDVRVLSLNVVRANEWRDLVAATPLTVTSSNDDVHIEVRRLGITSDPSTARDCDLVLICVPAFAHEQYLAALAPHLPDGCVVVGLPGQNGFEFDLRSTLGERMRSIVALNFDSLPWVCRTNEFARSATILGCKNVLAGAVCCGDAAHSRIGDVVALMQDLIGDLPRLSVKGHPLGITLRAPNAYAHPPMMFGRWKSWQGEAIDDAPLFYEGVDQATVDLLEEVSDEVLAIGSGITRRHPGVDLSQVIPLLDWDISCYDDVIGDKTNMLTELHTNGAYAGMRHPMIPIGSGGYAPDFSHRFLSEDVPFGLVVIRGIAELAGVATPQIDRVLCWSQHMMGREYLVGTRLEGRDVASSRAPQRYGFTLEDILAV